MIDFWYHSGERKLFWKFYGFERGIFERKFLHYVFVFLRIGNLNGMRCNYRFDRVNTHSSVSSSRYLNWKKTFFLQYFLEDFYPTLHQYFVIMVFQLVQKLKYQIDRVIVILRETHNHFTNFCTAFFQAAIK
jgi:hypothetical protein